MSLIPDRRKPITSSGVGSSSSRTRQRSMARCMVRPASGKRPALIASSASGRAVHPDQLAEPAVGRLGQVGQRRPRVRLVVKVAVHCATPSHSPIARLTSSVPGRSLPARSARDQATRTILSVAPGGDLAELHRPFQRLQRPRRRGNARRSCAPGISAFSRHGVPASRAAQRSRAAATRAATTARRLGELAVVEHVAAGSPAAARPSRPPGPSAGPTAGPGTAAAPPGSTGTPTRPARPPARTGTGWPRAPA